VPRLDDDALANRITDAVVSAFTGGPVSTQL
jgi:hypothetical protein